MAKDDPLIEAIGSLDELNAALGWAVAACEPEEAGWLKEVQIRLFDIGAELAATGKARKQWERLQAGDVRQLEERIDAWQAALPPLRSFVLPGGCEAAARLHVARTIARRAERRLVALQAQVEIRPVLLQYLNRLSDFLFVAARRANVTRGIEEPKYIARDTE